MLTSLKIDKKINLKDQTAKIVGNVKVTKTNRKVKVYLPLLMSNIKFDTKGSLKPKVVGKLDTSMFINAAKNKPKPSAKTIRSKYWIDAEVSIDSNVKNKTAKDKNNSGNITNSYLKHGTDVRVKFLSRKLNKARVTMDS